MSETLILKAQRRQEHGTRISRKLREQGLLPAIIYGHKKEPIAVQLNYHDLAMELQHHHRLLDVELDGQKEKYLLKDVQFDHLGDKILHVDLNRVDLNERVTVEVAVELRGIAKGVAEGGVMDQLLGEIEVECLVTGIPDRIRADVPALVIGQSLAAGQIPLPEGIKLVTDPNILVAIVHAKREEEEAAPAAAEEGAAEPEVITARPKEEEAEEEKEK